MGSVLFLLVIAIIGESFLSLNRYPAQRGSHVIIIMQLV